MNYRPITDTWILARSKVKYYGAYPGGFLSRARALLGVTIEQPVLHLCSGMVRDYPFDGFGPHDITVDLDPSTEPDLIHDIRKPCPPSWGLCDAILADPPYTEDDADHYAVGRDNFPSPLDCLHRAQELLSPGKRIGILHYIWPRPLDGMKNIAVVTVYVGFNNRPRTYSVYEIQ